MLSTTKTGSDHAGRAEPFRLRFRGFPWKPATFEPETNLSLSGFRRLVKSVPEV